MGTAIFSSMTHVGHLPEQDGNTYLLNDRHRDNSRDPDMQRISHFHTFDGADVQQPVAGASRQTVRQAATRLALFVAELPCTRTHP